MGQIVGTVSSQLWTPYTSTGASHTQTQKPNQTKKRSVFVVSTITPTIQAYQMATWMTGSPILHTFWRDVKKPGPHRALSGPGRRGHRSPARLQLGRFHSVIKSSLSARQNQRRRKNTDFSKLLTKRLFFLFVFFFYSLHECRHGTIAELDRLQRLSRKSVKNETLPCYLTSKRRQLCRFSTKRDF